MAVGNVHRNQAYQTFAGRGVVRRAPLSDEDSDFVFNTTDYDAFSFHELNRPIRPKHLENLTEAIKRKNLLRDFPILVDREYRIIDGQHRYLAAKALGLALYYKFTTTTESGDVPGATALVGAWKPGERLNTFVKMGKPEYIKMREFLDEFPFITVDTAIRLCTANYGSAARHGTKSRQMRELYTEGLYVANDVPFARKVARMLLDFKPYAPDFWRQGAFIHAVANLASNSEYDHARMLSKLEYLREMLHKCATIDQYFVVFDKIYNYRAKGERRDELKALHWQDARYRPEMKHW